MAADTEAKTLYIEPGSPWENGYCESFNSNSEMSPLMEKSSTPSKSFACWPNAGASTTILSHTLLTGIQTTSTGLSHLRVKLVWRCILTTQSHLALLRKASCRQFQKFLRLVVALDV